MSENKCIRCGRGIRKMSMNWKILLFFIFPASQVMILFGNIEAICTVKTLGWLGITLSVIADIVLLRVWLQGAQKEKLEKDLEEARYLTEVRRAYYQSVEKRQKELECMQKEFESQIKKVCDLIKDGKSNCLESSLNEMRIELEKTEPIKYCQNIVANAVLNDKQRACAELDFHIDADLRIAETLLVEPLHLCSVLSNLLDNAISANKVLDKSIRRISIQADMKGNYLFIKVQNPSSEEYAYKELDLGRGYGKQILESITKTYDGVYQDSYKDGIYTAVLMLKAIDQI